MDGWMMQKMPWCHIWSIRNQHNRVLQRHRNTKLHCIAMSYFYVADFPSYYCDSLHVPTATQYLTANRETYTVFRCHVLSSCQSTSTSRMISPQLRFFFFHSPLKTYSTSEDQLLCGCAWNDTSDTPVHIFGTLKLQHSTADRSVQWLLGQPIYHFAELRGEKKKKTILSGM